jgi:septum formation protein
MRLPPVILASTSPRRSDLLKELEIEFRVVPSDALELQGEQLTAGELARVNAYRKARAVAGRIPEALVIGADTLVYLGEQLFGKPRDLQEAREMLLALQGQTHQVVTGVCLMHRQSHRHKVFAEATAVRFKSLQPEQVDQYLSSMNPLDKAGAYAIQERGELIVAEISGSYSNVVGLPVERLRSELAAWADNAAELNQGQRTPSP